MFSNFGLLLVLSMAFFLSSNSNAFGQQIKYSLAPICNNGKITCPSLNEIPTCIVLNPRVHIETTNYVTGEKLNRYQPSCETSHNEETPSCIDTTDQSIVSSSNVALECIEFIKCEADSTKNKLIANCSQGKTPKCLGSTSNPDCESDTVCKNNSIPLCDYSWQATASNSF